MSRIHPGVFSFLFASVAAPAAMANGFLIYDLSGEAVGRASAVSADTTEPAAVWFNPAALAFLEQGGASIGAVFVTARSEFEAEATGEKTKSERGNFLIPSAFAHAPVADGVSIGMGIYSAFGVGVRWPNDWLGRENAIAATLETVAFNPVVAVRLHPKLSLAAGVSLVRSTVDYESGLPALIGGDARIAGSAWGVGGNAALLYRPIPDRFQLAFAYRTRVALHYDGNVDFEPSNPDFSRGLPDESGSAEITLPDIFTAGVMGRPVPELALTFDANLVLWTTYDEILIDFDTAPDRTLRPKGRNAFILRAAAEWSTPQPGLNLRAGLIFDQSALPPEGIGPDLPDSNHIDPTLGVGYERGGWSADLGYMLSYFLPSEAKSGEESPEGTYRTLAHLVGLTLGASF